MRHDTHSSSGSTKPSQLIESVEPCEWTDPPEPTATEPTWPNEPPEPTDIVIIRGLAEWFDTDHHRRFKREHISREEREKTKDVDVAWITLNMSSPPRDVSIRLVSFRFNSLT